MMKNDWVFIGKVQEYRFWKKKIFWKNANTYIYQVTKDDNPPNIDYMGYLRLGPLARVKGLTNKEIATLTV